jgi:hypothetical protein
MQAPVETERVGRVVVVPEVRPPRKPRLTTATVVLAVAALIAGAAGAYTWEQARVSDREKQLAVAITQRNASRLNAQDLSREVADLQDSVAALRQRVSSLHNGFAVASAGRQNALRQLAQARRELARRLEETSAQAAQLAALIGPPLSDGTHVGAIVAVGASQSPLRIVFDLEQWRTDTYGNHYVANSSPQWRTLQVATGATVTVFRWNGRWGPTHIDLAKLEQIFESPLPQNERVASRPFWVVISGGRVTSIREQPLK